jgi:hypothetical protein
LKAIWPVVQLFRSWYAIFSKPPAGQNVRRIPIFSDHLRLLDVRRFGAIVFFDVFKEGAEPVHIIFALLVADASKRVIVDVKFSVQRVL